MSKIGILALSHPDLGGTFQYTLSMIAALQRIPEHQYTIFTAPQNHSYDEIGLPVVYLPSPISILSSLIAARLLRFEGAGLFAEVEKVIAPIYSTVLLASPKPFAFTLHDLQERYFPQYFTVAQRLWRRVVNAFLARTASVIICESLHVKHDIERFLSVSGSRISVIAAPPVSGFSADETSAASLEAARESLDLPGQFIFYPAQFFPHKNHLRLVEAFAVFNRRHPDCHLLLTGQKRYEFDRVMARVNAIGLTERVRHLGYVDTRFLAAIYRQATLVVVPTLFESISIPVFEAFAVGTPVCASRIVALPEQIGDAGVLFDPTSVVDIAEKIGATFENLELRNELVARGRRRIAAFSVDQYADQLNSVLKRIQ